jgi:hypothetical protein
MAPFSLCHDGGVMLLYTVYGDFYIYRQNEKEYENEKTN